MTINMTGDNIAADNANWSFSGSVCTQFDQHINRSVPFYAEGHTLTLQLADYFINHHSLIYDIGCSTGQLTQQLGEKAARKSGHVIGIDCEPDMTTIAQSSCQHHPNIHIETANILDTKFEKTDLIVAYYTIQFIHPKHRQTIMNQLYTALNWGGGLIVFEKVRGADARFQDILTGIYHDYKLENGYTPDEIMNKSRSLKGILEPFSTQGNIDLLKRAGFSDITTIFKYACFEGFLAIK